MRSKPKAGPDEPTPEWMQCMWFGKDIPAELWAQLQSLPEHEFMPVITNNGNNCSLFLNAQNPEGVLRSWSARFSAPGQLKRKDPWLPSDVMNHAMANYASRSGEKDQYLQRMIDGKPQYLGRVPLFGRNLLGDSTCSAYRKIEGADWMAGYNVMRGQCAHSESNTSV